jgi:hypothetical protein
MRISNMHAGQLLQLTGCRYATLIALLRQLESLLPKKSLGRPMEHSLWTRLIVTLIKLRSDVAYRSLEVFLEIPFVTLHRYANRIAEMLATLPLFKREDQVQTTFLIVDGTCTRIRSSNVKDYSGYKHYKNKKVQMVVSDNREVIAVSKSYEGRVHDKSIWNQEFQTLKHLFEKLVLGDKAYAGGKGEDEILFRPIKRNELEYKQNKESSKAFNKELSRWRVTVEHVFAALKCFRILSGIFSLQPKRYGTTFKAIAVIYNENQRIKKMEKAAA